MKKSLYDIAFTFLETYCSDPVHDSEAKKCVVAELSRISSKVTAECVLSALDRIKRRNCVIDVNTVFALAGECQGKCERNLLDSNRFYMHHELRITPKPPMIMFDPDSGEMKRVQEPFFLEIAYSYTAHDLVMYFLSKNEMLSETMTIQRVTGAMNNLLQRYDVDTILFMIDAAFTAHLASESRWKLKTPFDVEEQLAIATANMNACMTQAKEEGSDRVVPRKRVLSR